jgi:hypothetical protein
MRGKASSTKTRQRDGKKYSRMRPIPSPTPPPSMAPDAQFRSNPSARQSKSKDSTRVRVYGGIDMALLFSLPVSFPSLGVLVPLLGVPFPCDVPCLPSLLGALVLLKGLCACLDGGGTRNGVRFRGERVDSRRELGKDREEVSISSSSSGFTTRCSFPCVASSSRPSLTPSLRRLPSHPACARNITRVIRDRAVSLGIQEP